MGGFERVTIGGLVCEALVVTKHVTNTLYRNAKISILVHDAALHGAQRDMLILLVRHAYLGNLVELVAHSFKSKILQLVLFFLKVRVVRLSLIGRDEVGGLLEDCAPTREHHDLLRDSFSNVCLLQELHDALIESFDALLLDLKFTGHHNGDVCDRVTLS